MTQNTRNRIAWVLAIVLVPTMVYLMVGNIREARRRSQARGTPTQASPISAPTPPPIEAAKAALLSPPSSSTTDSGILQEQKLIAAQMPKRNPFCPPVASPYEPAPPKTASPEPPPRISESPLELSGIVSGKTADRNSAIIGGRMLSVGSSIAGYKLVTIGTGEVVLESGTNRITLRLKQ
jgi:hypothetical protein